MFMVFSTSSKKKEKQTDLEFLDETIIKKNQTAPM